MASCGTLTVGTPFTDTAVFVTSCPAPSSGEPGSTQTLAVTVQNNNVDDAQVTLTATANGDSIGSASVVAGGGESTHDVPITLPDEPGDYTLEVNVTDASRAATAGMVQSLPGTGTARTLVTKHGPVVASGLGLGALGLAALSRR